MSLLLSGDSLVITFDILSKFFKLLFFCLRVSIILDLGEAQSSVLSNIVCLYFEGVLMFIIPFSKLYSTLEVVYFVPFRLLVGDGNFVLSGELPLPQCKSLALIAAMVSAFQLYTLLVSCIISLL